MKERQKFATNSFGNYIREVETNQSSFMSLLHSKILRKLFPKKNLVFSQLKVGQPSSPFWCKMHNKLS